MILSFVSVIAGIYVLFVLWMAMKFYHLSQEETPPMATLVPLTIIIPFRNEEDNLHRCLKNLKDQNDAVFSVICIDDHSTDSSSEEYKRAVGDDERFSLLKLKLDKGKKAAIELGMSHCQTEWVITRDADTESNHDNLKVISDIIQNTPEKEMIILPVKSQRFKDGQGIWQRIFAFEFHTLMSAGLACAFGNMPIMANGANMAFTKSLFEQLDGYRGNRSTSSGDDIFLLQKVAAKNRNLIGVSAEYKSAVRTDLPNSFRQWLIQRIRWGSKFRLNGSATNTFVALLVASMNATIIALSILTTLNAAWWKTLVITWVTKSIVDIIFAEVFEMRLNRVTNFLERTVLILINPFLFLLTVLLSFMWRPKWKGRKIEV